MTVKKNLGIWMDHANAHMMEFTTNPTETKTLETPFTNNQKGNTAGKSEHVMHNKEQHQRSDYYKEIGEVIRNYQSVMLFGPSTAKTELHNLLKADHRFENIKIEVRQSDKLTENQQHAFVRDYFSEK
jgi:hypothetical protein